jgi:hypothetical protein
MMVVLGSSENTLYRSQEGVDVDGKIKKNVITEVLCWSSTAQITLFPNIECLLAKGLALLIALATLAWLKWYISLLVT